MQSVFSLSRNLKLVIWGITSLSLASCSDLAFDNIPQINKQFSYITVQTPNLQIYRATRDAFARQFITIVPTGASQNFLAKVVYDIATAQNLKVPSSIVKLAQIYTTNHQDTTLVGKYLGNQQSQSTQPSLMAPLLVNTGSPLALEKEETITTKTPAIKTKPTQVKNIVDTILTTPSIANKNTADKVNKTNNLPSNITQCTGSNLTYTCVAQYIPKIVIDSFSRDSKTLSLYRDGSVAQVSAISSLKGTLSIPNQGSLTLYDLNTDQQLSNTFSPLANIQRNITLDKVYLGVVVRNLVDKIVYIFETESK